MSEKHLTEQPWNTLKIQHKIPDKTLQKALGNLNLCQQDDREGRLKALDEVKECAVKLKRVNTDNEVVVDYLEEVRKEAEKTYKALQLTRKGPVTKEEPKPTPKTTEKPQQEPKPTPKTEEKPEQETDPGLKGRLTNSLRSIKSAEGGESFAFLACVAKPFYGVLLGKSATETLGMTHKTMLTELTKGTKFISGRCLFEKNAHTFIVDPVTGGLAKNLKAALHHFTEAVYKVRVRDSDSKVIEDADAASNETIESLRQQFNEELLPRVRTLIAANPDRKDEIMAAVTLLNEKFKAGIVPAASEDLGKVAALVEDLEAMAPLKEKYEKLKPVLKDVFSKNPTLGEEIRTLAKLIVEKFQSGTSAEAAQALGKLAPLLLLNTQRFDEINRKYQAALKKQPANASELRAVMASVNASAENADFDATSEILTRLDELLDAAGTAGKEIDVIPKGTVDPSTGESIVSLKEKFEKLKPKVKELSNLNPTRSKEIDNAVALLNQKLEGTNIIEASAAFKRLAILLKSLLSPSVSTPQGSSSGAQPKQPTIQPTKPQPTPQPQQQTTPKPLEDDEKLAKETAGLITVLSYQDEGLTKPLLDFLAELPLKNKAIDNVADVTQRRNQRLALRDQLLEVQGGIGVYINTYAKTRRAYEIATRGMNGASAPEWKIYNKIADRLIAHDALNISKIFEDIAKLDQEFAEFNKNKKNLGATYEKAQKLCESLSKPLPLRKKEFEEKLESSGSLSALTALVKELEKLDQEGPEEAKKAMDVLMKVSDKDLNNMEVTKRIELLTNLRRGTAIQKGFLQKARNKLYRAMEMDKDFEKTDEKMRENVLNNVDKLIKTTDAKKNWPTMKDAEKESFLQKVLEIQCAEMKKLMPNFQAPKVTTFSKDAEEVKKDKLTTESGYFKGGKIYINDQKESFKDFADVINTVIHENTHNYQDQLVEMLEKGELEKDPRKNQAILFRLNQDDYQDSPKSANFKGKDREYDEAFEAYEKQPRELHAMRAGNAAKARFQG